MVYLMCCHLTNSRFFDIPLLYYANLNSSIIFCLSSGEIYLSLVTSFFFFYRLGSNFISNFISYQITSCFSCFLNYSFTSSFSKVFTCIDSSIYQRSTIFITKISCKRHKTISFHISSFLVSIE